MRNNIEYEPSITNYRRLLQQDNSDKFTIFFKIGSKENQRSERMTIKIESTVNKSRIISKKINNIFKIDPTISSYTFEIPRQIEKGKNRKVPEIIRLLIKSTTEKVEITKEQERLFNLIQYLIGETDLNDQKNKSTMITNQEEALSLLHTEFHQFSIQYLSSHFYQFVESGETKGIDRNIMKEIIDEYYLNVNSRENENNDNEIEKIFNKMKEIEEDRTIIFYFIISNDLTKSSQNMIEYIYENIDDEMVNLDISRIIYILKSHIIELIDRIYTKSKPKRKITANSNSNLNSNKKFINCEYSGSELSGIISYITNINKNSNLNEHIQISGGGDKCPSFPIDNIVKYDSKNINNCYFNWELNQPKSNDAWIKFDFGDKKINLSSYTIRSNNNYANSHAHPKSWMIYGSNDNVQWDLIDQRYNNSLLNGKYKQHRFECNNQNKYYRYIKFSQGDSWDPDKRYQYAVFLSCIEFFGSILY